MVKIIGNDLTRNGQKIGYLQGNDVYDAGGRKLGYYTSNDVYNHDGMKIAWLESSYIKYADGRKPLPLEMARKQVTGGAYSDLCRVATLLFVGA